MARSKRYTLGDGFTEREDLAVQQVFEEEWSLALVAPVVHLWKIDEPTRRKAAAVVC